MILTCPQCTTRFVLPAHAIGPDGRNVKCSSCGEIWFEEPDYDELAEAQNEAEDGDQHDEGETTSPPVPEFGDIPEGVKPDADEDFIQPEGEPPKEQKSRSLKTYILSYAAAACVFFLILGALMGVKSSILKIWPASAGLYKIFGVNIAVPGEGLVFDRVEIEATGAKVFKISGHVINLTSADQALPHIEANLRDREGKVLETWYIDTPESTVPAEADVKFTQNYHATHAEAHELFLRFALKKSKSIKTDVKDGDNTHAQSSGDHAHPSASAKDPKSHGRDSSGHH